MLRRIRIKHIHTDSHKHISKKQVTTKSLWLTHESLDSNQSRNASNVYKAIDIWQKHWRRNIYNVVLSHLNTKIVYLYAMRTCKSNGRYKNIINSNSNINPLWIVACLLTNVSLGSFWWTEEKMRKNIANFIEFLKWKKKICQRTLNTSKNVVSYLFIYVMNKHF